MDIRAKAYAKLNLTLDVLDKRPDGYHEMRMIMQDVALFDALHIKQEGPPGQVTIKTNLGYLPQDGRNIAVQAAQLFLKTTGIADGIAIHIRKQIPVGAGMAGGSADAAAVLRALNRMYRTGLSPSRLRDLAGQLGSDVPYCISGGTALATGRGERLSPLPPMPDCAIVIAKPAFSISTPKLFAQIDSGQVTRRPDTDGAMQALQEGDLLGLAGRLCNVFEEVLPPRFQEVFRIKERLLQHGAAGASMTGTGAAVFGLFPEKAAAMAAYTALRREYRDVFLTRPRV